MTSCGWTYHLSVINNAQIRRTHSIKVLVIIVWHENYFSIPLSSSKKFADVLFTFTAWVQTNYCDKIFKRTGFRTQRCWSWVLKQKLFNTSTCILCWEFSLWLLIARSEENNGLIIINLVLLTPLRSYIFNSLFQFAGKVLIASFKAIAIFADQVCQVTVLFVNVANCFVDSILTNILPWELILIASGSCERNSVMHVINILLCPLSEIFNEAIKIVAFWHFNSTVFVVIYS